MKDETEEMIIIEKQKNIIDFFLPTSFASGFKKIRRSIVKKGYKKS